MIGQTVSHYRILAELGGGGMGVVYKAEDTRLKRTVALKFLPPDLTRDKDAKMRFIHEAQAASALQHNNICTIHEIDETEDGRLFIAMDCYEGETLKDRIARGPLPVEEAIDFASQIAEGLAKAYEAGMIHRDIKPANIMITGDGVVKIVDFGLAKLAGQTKVTKTGTTVGTVTYMSPEQATGKEIDHRSDIFSLGVVLYEMLTGEVPFRGDHEAAVLYGIVNSEPERLATRRRGLPEKIQSIVDKAMAKNPNNRYGSTSDLLTDLSPFMPVRRGTGVSGATKSRTNYGRIVAVVGALAVIAVVAVIVVRHLMPSASIDDLSLAIVDFSTIGDADDRILSAGVTGLIHVGLVEGSPIRVVSPSYLQDVRRRLFGAGRGPIEDNEAVAVAKESGAAYLLTGQIARTGEDQFAMWRLMDVKTGRSLAAKRVDDIELSSLADRIVEGVLPVLAGEVGGAIPGVPTPVSTMTTEIPEAYRHFVAGTLALDEARENDAVRQFKQAIRIDTTFALAYLELSRTHSRESGPGRTYAEKAWAHRARLGEKDRGRLEAWMAWIDYRVKDALEVERGLLERWPDDQAILQGLAEKLFANWYAEDAARVAQQGLRLYPDNYRFGALCSFELAAIGRETEALDVTRRMTERHPQNPDAWDCLGFMYQQVGVPDSAVVSFEKALTIDPDFVWSQRNLAYHAYYAGNVNLAIDRIERLLERADLLPTQRLQVMTELYQWPGLAFSCAEQGRFEKAFEVIEQASQVAPDFERELRHIISPRNLLWLRTGKAHSVLASAASLAKRSDSRIAELKALEYRTMALAELDSLGAARAGVLQLRNAEEYWGGYSQVVANWVTAEIALREGDSDAALKALDDIIPYGIPFGAMFYCEHQEMRARAYVLAGRLKDAAEVHRELLRLCGGHALSHYELGKIYEEMDRPGDGAREFTIFLEMWSEADEGLPQLVDAGERLAALTDTKP